MAEEAGGTGLVASGAAAEDDDAAAEGRDALPVEAERRDGGAALAYAAPEAVVVEADKVEEIFEAGA